MIKVIFKGKVCNEFECVLENSQMATDLLRMIFSPPTNEAFSEKTIEIETDVDLIGKEYDVCDNSYCVNLANGEDAQLVQKVGLYYKPDEAECGARFFIVKKPYIEKVYGFILDNLYTIFVNVVSTKTGNIYRVIYNDDCVLA